MGAPSTHLVLIITCLQVNTIFNANGLTLPLQTVTTKCESIIKRPQKIYQECINNDKLACDSLLPDLSYPPLDSCARSSSLSSLGNCPFVISRDGLFTAPIIPKYVPFTSNVCPDRLLNVISSMSLEDPIINSCVSNSEPCGLSLPIAVSSSVNSLPPPNLKPSECINSLNKVPVPITNGTLDECVPVPTIKGPKAMSNQMSASNTCLTPCNSNVCFGFKSPLTVLTTSNCGSLNINLGPSNSQASVICNAVSQSKNPNLLGQPETSLPITLSLPSNNLPLLQTCPLNNEGLAVSNIVTSGTHSCNLASNAPNNIEKIGNISPSTVPYTCNFSLQTPDVSYSNQDLELTTASTSNIIANKLEAVFNNPTIPPSFTAPTISDISNLINKPQNCPTGTSEPLMRQSDMFCPFSVSNQAHFVPTSVPFNTKKNITPFCNYLTQLPLSPDFSLIPPVQGSNTCPNIPIYPQKGCAIPSQFNTLADPNLIISNENPTLSNVSPLSINQISPINKYFEDVRAATAKLNEFAQSFSSKLASKNMTQLPSQRQSVQSNITSLEEKFESTPLTSCSRPVPQLNLSLQQNIIPCEVPVASMNPAISSTQCCVDKTASLAPSLVPVTFRAPIVPKTIVSVFNFPICSAPVQCNNFHDNLALLSSSNGSPYPFTNLQATIPSNPFRNFGSCSNNLPDGSLKPTAYQPTIPSFMPKSLPSVLKRPILGTTLPNPIINTCEDITSILLPDLLSTVLPSSSCRSELPCKKSFPYISSISINTSPNCEKKADSCISSSGLSEYTLDSIFSSLLSSPNGSFLSFDSSLDECQLDLCFKKLENAIALLESSMDFTSDVDCD